MATEKSMTSHTRPVAADYSTTGQYFAMKLNTSEQWVKCSVAGERAAGILQDDPASGKHGEVAIFGISKAELGGTVDEFDPLTTDANGALVKADEESDYVLAIALKAGVSGDAQRVFICHAGAISALASVDALVSSGNYATTGQYLAVKVHTTAGQIVLAAVGGEPIVGILTNAPAALAVATVATRGPATFTAGTGGVSAGDKLAVEVTTSKLITATEGDAVVGFALAAVLADATGLCWLMPHGIDSSLADGKIFIGDAAGKAAAQTPSGDATMTRAGVITVDNVTVGSDAAGDLNYKTSATASARLAKGTAGQILRMNAAATAPEWGAVRAAQDDPEFAETFGYGAGKGLTLAGMDGLVGGATGAQILTLGSGIRLGYVPIIGQTIAPAMVATGLDIQCDQTDNDGLEIFSHMLGASGRPMRVGTDAAFFFKCSIIMTEPDGTDDLAVGWRKAEGHRAVVEDYTDMATLGCNTAADPMAIKTRCMINNAGTTNTDTTDTDAFGDAVEFHILVSAAGVVTFEVDSATPTAVGTLTFDDGDLVIPFLTYLQANADQTADFIISNWEVGYQ